MNGTPPPDHTPPAHTRVVSLESLDERVKVLEQQRVEDYQVLRDLADQVRESIARADTNHMAVLSSLGNLARLWREQ